MLDLIDSQCIQLDKSPLTYNQFRAQLPVDEGDIAHNTWQAVNKELFRTFNSIYRDKADGMMNFLNSVKALVTLQEEEGVTYAVYSKVCLHYIA